MPVSLCEYLHKSGIIDRIDSILQNGDYANYRNALMALDELIAAHADFEHKLLVYMDLTDER